MNHESSNVEDRLREDVGVGSSPAEPITPLAAEVHDVLDPMSDLNVNLSAAPGSDDAPPMAAGRLILSDLPPEAEAIPQLASPPPLVEPAPAPPPVWEPPPPRVVVRMLAGVETGILGALVMIGWFALDAMMERQYWWAMLNLWGSTVYHNRVFSMGLGMATLAGAAIHFFLHGLGGAAWGLVAGRAKSFWMQLGGSFAAAAIWYVFLMTAVWPAIAPLVNRISPHPATWLAYVLFGATLSRCAQRARTIEAGWIV